MASKNGKGFNVKQFRMSLQNGGLPEELVPKAILAAADSKEALQAVRAYAEHAQDDLRRSVPRDYDGRSVAELTQSHVNYQFGHSLGQIPVANGTAAVHKRWRAALPHLYDADGQPAYGRHNQSS